MRQSDERVADLLGTRSHLNACILSLCSRCRWLADNARRLWPAASLLLLGSPPPQQPAFTEADLRRLLCAIHRNSHTLYMRAADSGRGGDGGIGGGGPSSSPPRKRARRDDSCGCCDDQPSLEPPPVSAGSEEGGEHAAVGTGIYLLGSGFNHSCRPNARFENDGPTLRVRATESIPAGTEVTIRHVVPQQALTTPVSPADREKKMRGPPRALGCAGGDRTAAMAHRCRLLRLRTTTTAATWARSCQSRSGGGSCWRSTCSGARARGVRRKRGARAQGATDDTPILVGFLRTNRSTTAALTRP